MRTSFTYSQLETLETAFSEHNHVCAVRAECLAGRFLLPAECVVSWFSNRREQKRKAMKRKLSRETSTL